MGEYGMRKHTRRRHGYVETASRGMSMGVNSHINLIHCALPSSTCPARPLHSGAPRYLRHWPCHIRCRLCSARCRHLRFAPRLPHPRRRPEQSERPPIPHGGVSPLSPRSCRVWWESYGSGEKLVALQSKQIEPDDWKTTSSRKSKCISWCMRMAMSPPTHAHAEGPVEEAADGTGTGWLKKRRLVVLGGLVSVRELDEHEALWGENKGRRAPHTTIHAAGRAFSKAATFHVHTGATSCPCNSHLPTRLPHPSHPYLVWDRFQRAADLHEHPHEAADSGHGRGSIQYSRTKSRRPARSQISGRRRYTNPHQNFTPSSIIPTLYLLFSDAIDIIVAAPSR